MAFVYMLLCEDGSLYTGITTDILRRMREHCKKKGVGAKYTRAHPVRELAALWELPTLREAARVEYRLKRLTPAKKRALVEEPSRLGSAEFPLPDGLCPMAAVFPAGEKEAD